MPLLKFDVITGRNDQELRTILDTTHQAMVEAFEVPATDRYQSVTQHRPAEMVLEDTGLGFRRSDKVVVLTVISRRRTEPQKQKFYRLLAERLHEKCGLSPDDLIVSIVENSDADWSFGHGRAQFLTNELS
ncbi:tautomerase family protein [Dyella flagellata]|uniref:Tautomerase YolI n=1 Tax=Dyella flagellata TaxID=1867833 RepID=A0ABQ5XCI9_9GAMM|nr:tautomerase family protein [Dyella flagellata]GLQ88245.1 putative tautomerase YolI [Dyella flagellata]